MKRDRFIKTLAILTGGLTAVGCNPSLIDDMVAPDDTLDDLSIDEAEKWFYSEYLSKFNDFQNEKRDKTHRRSAAWKKAKKPKTKKNTNFGWVWVPLDYTGNERPAVVIYDDETKYKVELSRYFQQPIIEGLVVMRVREVNTAFLGQIAYDPFALEANGYKLEKENFTGTLIRSDWNDVPLDGSTFVNGKMIAGFSNQNTDFVDLRSEKARIESCSSLYVTYVTVTTAFLNNEYHTTIENHNSWINVCVDGSGNGGWSGSGRCGDCPGDNNEGSYSEVGGGSGNISHPYYDGDGFYDPLVNSGAGISRGIYPTNSYHNFNLEKAISVNGADRRDMNANLRNTLFATELSTGISTWSFAKADALARSAGLNLKRSFPLIFKGVTRIGYASAIYGAINAIIVVKEGGDLTKEEMIMLGAGVIVGAAAALTTGWIAVGLGAVSLGITIYQESN